jgi:sugar lactone lactonase YvrE
MRPLNLIPLIAIGCLIGCANDTPRVETSKRNSPHLEARAELAKAKDLASQPQANNLELIAATEGPMPTGIAVSKSGRIFVNFPRWGDPVEFTVAELKDGKLVPYPNLPYNKLNTDAPDRCLVSVQSVVTDNQDRLWLIDTGSINFQPILSGGAKLICVDLSTNQIVKTINFRDQKAVLPTTYLNDIRFAPNQGKSGYGFITDSSQSGPNGIIVVDLETGEAWRRLHDHPSTVADLNANIVVEGERVMTRMPGKEPQPLKIGSDGIAITPDGGTLYYRPLISHHFYSVPVDILSNRSRGDDQVAAAVKDLGDIGFASDGMDCDGQGRLYLTDYDHHAIRRREPNGKINILVHDPRLIWPDSIDAHSDPNYAYFTVNQLNRQKQFNYGKDLRQPPYAIFRAPLNATTTQPVAQAR